jgi:hypothetical protein
MFVRGLIGLRAKVLREGLGQLKNLVTSKVFLVFLHRVFCSVGRSAKSVSFEMSETKVA